METQISPKDKSRIETGIRGEYVKVARSPVWGTGIRRNKNKGETDVAGRYG